jgi:hypothetical protein
MAAPPQLQRAHRPRRSSPRQLVERVRERLDIKELLFLKAFPNQRLEQGNRNRIEGFRFPWCRRLVVSLYNIEVHHFNGRVEVVGVKLYDMPHGDPWRRARWLVCPDCGKTRRRLYFHRGKGLGPDHCACRRCHDLGYRSQQSSKKQRWLTRDDRDLWRLDHKPMHKKKRQDILERRRQRPRPRGEVNKRYDSWNIRVPVNWFT